MLFTVSSFYPDSKSSPRSRAYLVRSDWDDWFEFATTFTLVVFDHEGIAYEAGRVKIGQFGMKGQRSPNLPAEFEALDSQFFSLGQDEDYYETLNKLAPTLCKRILTGLRDVAVDLTIFEKAREERVMTISLLRSIAEKTVRGRFNRIANGDAKLTAFNVAYEFPVNPGGTTPLTLSFDVIPESMPPTNVHVLIGRNGVGKTRCLNLMTRSLVEKNSVASEVGVFSSVGFGESFANMVSVSFSAFDPFDPLADTPERHEIPYAYIGLRPRPPRMEAALSPYPASPIPQAGSLVTPSGLRKRPPKTPDELVGDFVESAEKCLIGSRAIRWRRALEVLEADPLFQEYEVTRLAEPSKVLDWRDEATKLYKELSSGHKIVLLTITSLVEKVLERTLVLIDEPETHLHPPLLSAFVRSLSDLLIQRNGVAIIATHSPVILQETPKTCVWILRRSGLEVTAERPEAETFGENVGVLTREVFGLEVTQSGFHKLLQEAVATSGGYEAVLERFDQQLGAEARAIARGMIATRDAAQHKKDEA